MVNIWRSIHGTEDLTLTCADTIALLNAFSNAGIEILNAVYRDELVLSVTIYQIDHFRISKICEKIGASVRIENKKGVYWYFYRLRKHPVLISFFIFILFAGLFLPNKVLFIQVEGNYAIPTNEILEAAAECGICFGASRREVRSEVMKNELLQKISNIQWAGVNTIGCTAIISVKEKTVQNMSTDHTNTVRSIVASRDGVIQNMTVTAGNPLCSVGQAVRKGQILVSGYTDCGLLVKTSCADAEVNALTFRRLDMISPYASKTKRDLSGRTVRYSLRIGKKVINLYKDSGILGSTCDKIYLEESVVLPGGYTLPVSVIKETISFYTDTQQTATTDETKDWLLDAAEAYLQGEMIAGQIVSAETERNYGIDAAFLHGQYACLEMIGQLKYEDTLPKDE